MKSLILSFALIVSVFAAFSQSKSPASCKIFLNEQELKEPTVAQVQEWCEQEPPMVICDDGTIYRLENFQINFMTLKPFQNQDFGIGQKGFPILARRAVKNAKPGDTIILKEATYLDKEGKLQPLPIISVKFY
jgi:hypothetical protein